MRRGRLVCLCTNGMFIVKRPRESRRHRIFLFNLHLNGLRETHDMAVERPGMLDMAIEGSRAAN